ncbi:MAG: lipase family protein [Dehalococcoidia bacterium]|nr:lipase family protein [Dehalococcoidia bacterium]
MEAFRFDAHTREHSILNALWLGRACRQTFGQTSEQTRASLAAWGLTDFEPLDRGDTQGYIAGDSNMLILAFRGTESLADWMTDFNIRLLPGPAGKVHVGFKVALLQVWAQIWDYLQANRRGRSLWVTGHSLGGALATMAVAKLRLEHDEPVNGLYTYGGPRIGDRDFQRAFDADFERQTYRYVNNSDIVSRIPLRTMAYSHVGLSKYFDRTGQLRDDLSW